MSQINPIYAAGVAQTELVAKQKAAERSKQARAAAERGGDVFVKQIGDVDPPSETEQTDPELPDTQAPGYENLAGGPGKTATEEQPAEESGRRGGGPVRPRIDVKG